MIPAAAAGKFRQPPRRQSTAPRAYEEELPGRLTRPPAETLRCREETPRGTRFAQGECVLEFSGSGKP